MDYPFNLKGILYFPKINTEYESIEGTIKLYNNQVFVADNIKEVIPEFLHLMYLVVHYKMMVLLRKYQNTLQRRLATSFQECIRQTKKTTKNTGMTSTHLSNLVA